jgi:hypothetical protein
MITKALPKPKHISNEDKHLITKNHFISHEYFILFFELVASVAFIVERIKGRTKLVGLKERNDGKQMIVLEMLDSQKQFSQLHVVMS